MVFFRVDGNDKIASGHIMRCLSIANVFRDEGEKVIFLLSDNNAEKVISSQNFDFIILNSQWNDLLKETEKVNKILVRYSKPLVIIDTYSVCRKYVETILPYSQVCYLGSKKEYLGRLYALINYNIDIDKNFYELNYRKDNTILMLGSKYAPLRKEFQNYKPYLKRKVSHILLTTGNTDKQNIVGSILDGIYEFVKENNIIIDVVIGSMFVYKNVFKEKYSDSNYIILHENVTCMSSLMKKCELAVSANGTTVYELAAMGIPAITFSIVEEQIESAECFSRLNAAKYCGSSYNNHDKCLNKILNAIKEYCFDYNKRAELSNIAHKLIDGNGCKRIVSELLASI